MLIGSFPICSFQQQALIGAWEGVVGSQEMQATKSTAKLSGREYASWPGWGLQHPQVACAGFCPSGSLGYQSKEGNPAVWGGGRQIVTW